MEMLKYAGRELKLAYLINRYIEEGKVPNGWYKATIIIIDKKGDIRKLTNYKPIS